MSRKYLPTYNSSNEDNDSNSTIKKIYSLDGRRLDHFNNNMKNNKQPLSPNVLDPLSFNPNALRAHVSPSPAQSSFGMPMTHNDKLDMSLMVQLSELVNADMSNEHIINHLLEACLFSVNGEKISFLEYDPSIDETCFSLGYYVLSKDLKDITSNSKSDEPVPLVRRKSVLKTDKATIARAAAENVPSQKFSSVVPIATGIAGFVLKTGKPICINQAVESDWRFDPNVDSRHGTVRSILTVPVRNSCGKYFGVLEVLNCLGGFTEDSLNTCLTIASFLTTLFLKADMKKDLQLAKKQTTALLQMAESSLDISEVVALGKITKIAGTVVGSEALVIYKVDNKGDIESESEPVGSFVSECLSQGRTIRVDSVNNNNAESILVVPIKDIDGKIYAIMRASNISGKKFTVEDQDLLTAVAANAGGILTSSRLYDEAEQRRKQTEALLRIADLMSAEIGTEKVVPKIIESAYSLVPSERISLFLVQEDYSLEGKKCLVCIVTKDECFKGARIQWGAGIVGHVALTKKTMNIPNAYEDTLFDSTSDRATGFKTQSILTVPVTDIDGQVVAVMQAANRIKKLHSSRRLSNNNDVFVIPYSKEDVALLESMCGSAGTLLKKSKLLTQAIISQRKSQGLMKLVKLAADKISTMEEAIDGIVEILYSVLDADRVSVFFVDQNRGEVFSLVSLDNQGYSLPIGHGIIGSVAKTGCHLNIPDAYSDSRFNSESDIKLGYTTKSILCMPVKNADGATVAVISCLNKRVNRNDPFVEEKDRFTAFSEDDIEVLEAFCVEASSIIHKYLVHAILGHADINDRTDVESMLNSFNHPQLISSDSIISSVSHVNEKMSLVSSKSSGPDSEVYKLLSKISWPLSSYNNILFLFFILSVLVDCSLLQTIQFNVWQYNPDDLMVFTYYIFEKTGLLSEFKIPTQIFKNFICCVRGKYRDNPFHNWYHGFSVLHFSYIFANLIGCDWLTRLELLSVFISSLCHDIDHPGRNNSFEINTESELAFNHNDTSVLENHHALTMFTLLRDPDTDIFLNVTKESKKLIRRSMILCILSTDMAFHFDKIGSLNSRDSSRPFDKLKDPERMVLMETIVHTSDLSAQTLPTVVAKTWEERISQEFEGQAKEEAAMGLPVAPFMQNLSDGLNRSKLQANFIEFVLEPWWRNIARLFPTMQPSYANLLANKAFFQNMAKMVPN